jgi:hypothetical protein
MSGQVVSTSLLTILIGGGITVEITIMILVDLLLNTLPPSRTQSPGPRTIIAWNISSNVTSTIDVSLGPRSVMDIWTVLMEKTREDVL